MSFLKLVLTFSIGSLLAMVTPVMAESGQEQKSKTHYFRVDGLACPFCAYGIEQKFKRIQGVEKAQVYLKHGTVFVKTNEPRHFSTQRLKRLFQDAGFTYQCRVDSKKGQCSQGNQG